MREADEHSITDAVLQKVSGATDPRFREIGTALVRHLHEFVREVEPTQDEWDHANDFLTRTGQMRSRTRQEFILLSDMLGVSVLVDAINHRLPGSVTEATVLGPFHVARTPEVKSGAAIGAPAEGPPLPIEGRVGDTAGAPIGDDGIGGRHHADQVEAPLPIRAHAPPAGQRLAGGQPMPVFRREFVLGHALPARGRADR